MAWWEKASLPPNSELVNTHNVLLFQGHFSFALQTKYCDKQILWFSNLFHNLFSDVYFILFIETTLVFKIFLWISFQRFIWFYFLSLPLFSKCILELLFNTVIRPLKSVYWQSKGLPSSYVSGKVRESEDAELYSGVKQTLKLMWEQPRCPSLPPSLPACRYFRKWKSCVFLKGVRNDSPCTHGRVGSWWWL